MKTFFLSFMMTVYVFVGHVSAHEYFLKVSGIDGGRQHPVSGERGWIGIDDFSIHGRSPNLDSGTVSDLQTMAYVDIAFPKLLEAVVNDTPIESVILSGIVPILGRGPEEFENFTLNQVRLRDVDRVDSSLAVYSFAFRALDHCFTQIETDEMVCTKIRLPGFSDPNLEGEALQAGDANQDFEFNFDDILLVLGAGKFETGQPATWGEGDWDGGPGGSLGSPPPGDGFFNFDDILDALGPGLFETGPYAAGGTPQNVALGHAAAVPEPSAMVLIGLGLVALMVKRVP